MSEAPAAQRWSSRRFVLSISCLAAFVWLRAHDHLGDAAFTTVVTATIGAYMTASAHQRQVEAKATEADAERADR
jgi:hypothetical protein